MSSNGEKTPVEVLKEKGNSLYLSYHFAEAEEAYSSALALILESESQAQLKSEDEPGNLFRPRAVLYSNRANARMARGNYEGTSEDSRQSLLFIAKDDARIIHGDEGMGGEDDDEADSCEERKLKNQVLRGKNQWRLARSLFYANDRKILKQLLDESGDEDLRRKAGKFVAALDYTHDILMKNAHDNAKSRTTSLKPKFVPQTVRSNLVNPICEYHPFGHDPAESALKDMKFRPSSTKQDINILYGGVGDGRHVLATILDAHSRTRSSPENFKYDLHITMNDINKQVLAKDLLTLVLSYRIRQLSPGGMKFLRSEDGAEAAMLMTVLYYSLLGYYMPAGVFEKQQAVVKETFLDVSYDTFHKQYPWITIEGGERDWKEFQRVVSYWVDPSKYEPALPSIEDISDAYRPQDPSSKIGPDIREKIEARNKAAAEEFVQAGMSTWPDNFREEVERLTGEDASEEEIRECASEALDEMIKNGLYDDNTAAHVGAWRFDKVFMDETKGVQPPFSLTHVPTLDEENDIFCEHICFEAVDRNDEDEVRKSLKTFAVDHIQCNWKVNPVRYDPDFHGARYQSGIAQHEEDRTHYVIDWGCNYFDEEQTKLFSEEAIPDEENGDLLFTSSLFHCFAYFYINVGHALNDLVDDHTSSNCNKLSIEVSTFSVLDYGMKCSNTAETMITKDPEKRFTSIYLSNIPDYTGMMSIFIQLGALLEEDGAAQSTLRSNVLLNPPIFQNYDEYVYGTVALSVKQIERILKIRILDDHPDVWNTFNRWERKINDPEENPVSPTELKMWLHRLYMNTVIPPQRDSVSPVVEAHPNTLGLFLYTCKYCIDVLKYPIQWVTEALEQLLLVSNEKPLKTVAAHANKAPTPVLVETKSKKYNLTACKVDLENELAMFLQGGLLPQTVASYVGGLPKRKPMRYMLKFDSLDDRGFLKTSCLGFLLEKEINPDFDPPTFAQMFNDYRFGGKRASPTSKLREALLEKGDKVGHLFSSVAYNSVDDTALFWMCEDVFERFKGYHFSIVRTDSFCRLDHKDVLLGDAVPV